MQSELFLTAPAEPLLLASPGKLPQAKPARAFAQPRDFLDNRFVYLTVSPRARGLSIGVNINPDRQCNFDCVYCEVDRTAPITDKAIDCEVAARELTGTLRLVREGGLRHITHYGSLPEELLQLRHVALSGDGEPTMSPQFLDAVESVVHVRARGEFPFFKIVLITNASGLNRLEVQTGLSLLTARDEIWAKLDAGSAGYFNAVNRPSVAMEDIFDNILQTARRRPVIVQSLFCQVSGAIPSIEEIDAYALRLRDLKERGAQIPLVQIYSATRPTPHSEVRHLPLKTLSDIAVRVRQISGLKAEPF